MNEDKVGFRVVVKNRLVVEGWFLCDRFWELGWVIEDVS